MSIREQIGVCLGILAAAILIAAISVTTPGFTLIALLAVVWAAKELEVFDMDAELALLLRETA